ncbi:hypothetical protein F5876DRAFT_53840, partial [Lentinula aff. lateritia]
PIVIVVQIHDWPVCALIDSGSLRNFMSTQLSDQLKITEQFYKILIPLYFAIQGLQSKSYCDTTVKLKHQNTYADYYFDIVNIPNFNLILSIPWLFQYQVRISLNSTTIEVGSNIPTPIQGDNVAEVCTQSIFINDNLEDAQNILLQYAKLICKTAAETPLLPLCHIKHTVPLIDKNKFYPWCLCSALRHTGPNGK